MLLRGRQYDGGLDSTSLRSLSTSGCCGSSTALLSARCCSSNSDSLSCRPCCRYRLNPLEMRLMAQAHHNTAQYAHGSPGHLSSNFSHFFSSFFSVLAPGGDFPPILRIMLLMCRGMLVILYVSSFRIHGTRSQYHYRI
ncbi:hypothetical protein O3G_MSEX014965 [Manduca sexta]|uniref:Uncharacterized protein n=1 Tax=Manduca sexta TaxID=7130 RepID=A0A921ZVG7_MANSE|nr:hypothetical protein O3G_MSEX014965 [Manduca sexta]